MLYRMTQPAVGAWLGHLYDYRVGFSTKPHSQRSHIWDATHGTDSRSVFKPVIPNAKRLKRDTWRPEIDLKPKYALTKPFSGTIATISGILYRIAFHSAGVSIKICLNRALRFQQGWRY
jgi:hypothetical protein